MGSGSGRLGQNAKAIRAESQPLPWPDVRIAHRPGEMRRSDFTIKGVGKKMGRSGRRTIVASLKEFLAVEGHKLRNEHSDAITKRKEWIAAVDRLLAQIKDWIQQADPEQILMLQETSHQLPERMIGTYEVHGLSIGVGLRELRVTPVARYVAGPMSSTGTIRAYGRVDFTN
jgi:hypothetical protein